MIVGRITAKAQTTIPRAVRLALGIKPGDEIGYEIEGDRVVMRRVGDPFDKPFASFSDPDVKVQVPTTCYKPVTECCVSMVASCGELLV